MPSDDVQTFATRATDAELDELRARLAAARLPEAETVLGAAPGARRWDQGVPLADLVEIVNYWRTGYDWRAFEERLHAIGQFRTTIDGLGIHFLHRRSARTDATPLILTHGWPGSVAEFVDVMDELADPQDADAPAFHVVAPSLPGFGYSDKPAGTGWGTEKIAAAWVELMGRLGYRRFVAHGGDWGGVVTTVLGGRFPEHVLGIHTVLAQAPPRADDGRADSGRTRVDRGDSRLLAPAVGVREAAGDTAADNRLLARRLAGRAARVDCRQVRRVVGHPGQPVRDDLQGSRSGRRHAVLADADRGVRGAHLLREPPVARPRAQGRRPDGRHGVSAGHREVPAALGGEAVPADRPLEDARGRRALPITGGA